MEGNKVPGIRWKGGNLMDGEGSTWTISKNLKMKQSEVDDDGNGRYEANEYLGLTKLSKKYKGNRREHVVVRSV